MVTGDSPRPPHQHASGPGRPSRPTQAGMKDRPGVRGIQQVTEWVKTKYSGSLAEYLWKRLDSMDFIDQATLFASTLLLCFFPFAIVANALTGQTPVGGIVRHLGLNRQAAADAAHLVNSSAATSHAFSGVSAVVWFVLGGTAAASALQALYERAFDLDHRGMKDIWRRLIWLALLLGAVILGNWGGPRVRHIGGPVLAAAIGVVALTGFWWLTMWLLLAGRVSWRRLFPSACATGVFWVGMDAVFTLIFSGMVISQDKQYGPIGIIFALMAYLIAIGVVVILGAVTGIVWQERGPSFRGARTTASAPRSRPP